MGAQPPALTEWQAHQRRSKRALVVDAIKRLDKRGARITFAAVAEEAGVDRSWLYSHEDLAAEIKRLRDETRGPLEPWPQRERERRVAACSPGRRSASQRRPAR
jgi:uncharacterized protein DUF6262